MKPSTTNRYRIIVLMAAALMSPPLTGEDLPYDSGSTGEDGPLVIPTPIGDRLDHAAAFHAGLGKLVVFGGYNAGGRLNDTWVRETPSWEVLATPNQPEPRDEHAMVYDAARDEIVLFGGDGTETSFLADTWTFDGITWTKRNPATSPPGRIDHAMAYDSAREEVVLFGGVSESGKLQDTWVYDGSTWTERSPGAMPSARRGHAIAYDAGRQRTVLFGGDESFYDFVDGTWEWDGAEWHEIASATRPPGREDHAMAYDPVRGEIVMAAGHDGNFLSDTWVYGAAGWVEKSPANPVGGFRFHILEYDPVLQKVVFVNGRNDFPRGTTRLWDGSDWEVESDGRWVFDMSGRENGVWNYTTIDVPREVEVVFRKNSLNTPVRWLASGNVTIGGTLNLDGEGGRDNINVEPGNEAIGGPGGYRGGLGGRAYSVAGSYVGTPGGGPGGGAPGSENEHGEDGRFTGVYGNTFLQPLVGGSGGGGSSSNNTRNGGNGGAGGGAILIASSRDIILNGEISTDGGGGSSGSRYGGDGSGGAIRLVADRVLGDGALSADGRGANGDGRIRIEGYFRPLAGESSVRPFPAAGPPTETLEGLEAGAALTIASVDGANVKQPPQGNRTNPDVIFTNEGEVAIVVSGTVIPDGTPVTLRIATSEGILNLPADGEPEVTMTGNSASFTATVPAGLGTIQAFATLSISSGNQ